MAEKQCEFLPACPMFAYFCRAAEEVYREVYCEGDYERCQRRQLRRAGKPVPVNLLPHGGVLWEEGDQPPKFWT